MLSKRDFRKKFSPLRGEEGSLRPRSSIFGFRKSFGSKSLANEGPESRRRPGLHPERGRLHRAGPGRGGRGGRSHRRRHGGPLARRLPHRVPRPGPLRWTRMASAMTLDSRCLLACSFPFRQNTPTDLATSRPPRPLRPKPLCSGRLWLGGWLIQRDIEQPPPPPPGGGGNWHLQISEGPMPGFATSWHVPTEVPSPTPHWMPTAPPAHCSGHTPGGARIHVPC